jgi:hypothetical protein
MASEVTELIAALRDGSMTLTQVENRFKERSWPRTQRGSDPQTYLQMAAAAQRDPEPDVPGSFDDVVAAYDRGDLTREEYRTLAEAAAEGMRKEDLANNSRSDS